MRRKQQPEQLYLDGTAPPSDPIVDKAVRAWRDAVDARAGAALDAKMCHEVLVVRLQERNISAYPYIDRATGQRRIVKISSEPKIKTAPAPTLCRPSRPEHEPDDEHDDDPFAATRDHLADDGVARSGLAATWGSGAPNGEPTR